MDTWKCRFRDALGRFTYLILSISMLVDMTWNSISFSQKAKWNSSSSTKCWMKERKSKRVRLKKRKCSFKSVKATKTKTKTVVKLRIKKTKTKKIKSHRTPILELGAYLMKFLRMMTFTKRCAELQTFTKMVCLGPNGNTTLRLNCSASILQSKMGANRPKEWLLTPCHLSSTDKL